MDLPPDWSEFIRLLNSHDVEFLIVGAFAVSFHSVPRLTADIDLLVNRSEANAARLREALEEFDFKLSDDSAKRLQMPDQMLKLGVAPYRIDVLTSIKGLCFEEAWKERVVAELGGHRVAYPSKRHTLASKLAVNRTKDLPDVERLKD
jgi:hypothetical protein